MQNNALQAIGARWRLSLRADVLQKRDGTREVAGYAGGDGITADTSGMNERNGKRNGRDGDEV